MTNSPLDNSVIPSAPDPLDTPLTPTARDAEAAGVADGGETTTRPESPLARFWRRFRSSPVNLLSAGFLLLLVVVAILAPLLAPMDPLRQDLLARRLPPFSPNHLLGTDNLGRDTLSRLIHGTRVALVAAAISVGIGLALSVVPALVAGYLGRWVDAIISRVADTLLAFPPLLLAMAIVGVMGPNLTNAMLAIGVVFAPRFFRIIRSAVIAVRNETFIEASRSIGTPTWKILYRHVLPNVLSPLIVQISLACGFAILSEASLSFIGLGVQPPSPSWGRMLSEGRESWFVTPWPIIVPAVTIVLSVLASNLIGDGIRDSVGREVRKG